MLLKTYSLSQKPAKIEQNNHIQLTHTHKPLLLYKRQKSMKTILNGYVASVDIKGNFCKRLGFLSITQWQCLCKKSSIVFAIYDQ